MVAVILTGHARHLASQAPAASPRPERALISQLRALVREHEARFPALTEVLSEKSSKASDAALEFGLERILDGVEALIVRRAPP